MLESTHFLHLHLAFPEVLDDETCAERVLATQIRFRAVDPAEVVLAGAGLQFAVRVNRLGMVLDHVDKVGPVIDDHADLRGVDHGLLRALGDGAMIS